MCSAVSLTGNRVGGASDDDEMGDDFYRSGVSLVSAVHPRQCVSDLLNGVSFVRTVLIFSQGGISLSSPCGWFCLEAV